MSHQDLLDRRSEHRVLQELTIRRAPVDFRFLFGQHFGSFATLLRSDFWARSSGSNDWSDPAEF